MKAIFTTVSLAVLGLSMPRASGLTINVTYDSGLSTPPAADPSGTLLTAIMEAAASYWEDIIQDAGTLDITFYYQNGINGNALMSNGVESGGRFTSALIRFEGAPSYGSSTVNTWYYDPTPLNNSEYDMVQTLYRDLSPSQQAAMWTGNPPQLIEAGFRGTVAAGAPAAAQSGADIWTYALHELGHALGMSSTLASTATELLDNDYDISSNFTNGAVCATLLDSGGGSHVECTMCAMNTSIGPNNRRLPCAADILSIATCPSPGWSNLDLQRQDFLPAQGGVNTDWNTPGNWIGGAVPGSLDDASIRIGKLAGVVDGIDIQLSGNVFCRNFFLGEATDVQSNAFKLTVGDTATIEYDGSGSKAQFFVEAGGELEVSNDLRLNGGELDMTGGLADINDDVFITENTNGTMGEITGFGTVDVASVLHNDGRITATDLVANTLTFTSANAAPWNLDGGLGNGEVFATLGNLNFANGGLTDAFDGLIQIGDPFTLNISQGWTLGSGGKVDINGGATDFANLTGGLITAGGGEFECSLRCLVTAPVNFSGSFQLTLLGSGELEMDAFTTCDGGTYTLGTAALFELDGGSILQAGTFNLVTDSELRTDGATTINGGIYNIGTGATLNLNGAHTLQGGTYTGSGTLRFGGATTIAQPVVIDCDILDFDGVGLGTKQVTLNNDLTVNSEMVDTAGANDTFNSTLTINNNFAQLTVNGPPSWTMAGTLNHNSGTNLTFPSIAGVPFTMSGTANVTGGTAWNARTTITGVVNLNNAADTLSIAGGGAPDPNRIAAGSVNGPGRFRAFQTHLSGHGQVGAVVDFATGTSLLADDGTLTLASSFLNVPPLIGTADADGILTVVNPWTLPSGNVLELNGGSVTGGTVTNAGVARGFGTIGVNQITNNGEISATDGMTLVINTNVTPDLDGLGTPAETLTHTLNAVEGNLTVVDLVTDPFGGTATVAPGRTLAFNGGWTLSPGAILNMTGNGTGARAILQGANSALGGILNLDDEILISSPATFGSTATVNFNDPSTALRMSANSSIAAGADFIGPGIVANITGNTMTLLNGADLGASLFNAGIIAIGSSPGTAGVDGFSQTVLGRLEIELLGLPNSSSWDRLVVSGTATLAGTLDVTFAVAGAQAGDTWKVMDAGAVSGSFGGFSVSGLPAGLVLLKIEAADGVYLKLATDQTYAAWAAAEGIPPGMDAINGDADNDSVQNGIEMILNGDPMVSDPGILPAAQVANFSGTDHLSLTILLSTENVPSGLVVRVARSTDLVSWSTSGVVVAGSTYDAINCIETRTYRSTTPAGNSEKEFLRISLGP